MAYFADAQDVYDHIGRLFRDLQHDPELAPRFRRADTVVRFELSDPASAITAKMVEGEAIEVDLGASELTPELTMSMEADTAHRFWLGKVDVTVALARAQVTAHGPVGKILELLPLVAPMFPRYRATLEAEGRTDLLEVN